MLKDLDIYHYYSDLFICCTYTVFYSNIKNGGNTYDDYQKRTLTSQEASGTSEALDYFGRCHPNHTSSQSQSEKKNPENFIFRCISLPINISHLTLM